MKHTYLFTSERLGFRQWKDEDMTPFARMNSDKEVMEHFPSTLDKAGSDGLLMRLNEHFDTYGHTYFAVDELSSGTFIGFIGLVYQDYESPYTPAIDIGWRLKPEAWGKGYAT